MRNFVRLGILGGLACALSQSCGSGDDKKRVTAAEEGGEAGQPGIAGTSPSGGQPGSAGESTLPGVGGVGGDATASEGGAGGASSNECPAGFAECDGDLSDACEQDLSELTSCGDCDTSCVNAHGGVECRDLACFVTSCDAGYGDCNGDASDGCETLLADNDEHCGECGRDCTSVGATCNVDSCGDIPMQQNLSVGNPTGPFNDRAWAFSAELGIVNMTRSPAKVTYFSLDGVTSKVIWDSVNGTGGNEALLIDGQDVVWAQQGPPGVVRKKAVTAASAAAPIDLFQPQFAPVYLRLQGDYYYFITGDGEPAYVYRRLRTAASTDVGTRIVNVAQGSSASLSGFAVTTDAIYWITYDDGNAGTADNDLRYVPLAGGVPASIPKIVGAVDGQIKEFGNATITPSLTAIGDAVYFARQVGASPGLNGIYRFKQGDAAPTRLVEAQAVTTLGFSDTSVYYGLIGQQGVLRAPLGGGQSVMVGKSYQTTILGTDDTFAYVAFVNSPAYLYKVFK